MQTTINGLKLSYTDAGRGQTLVFVHGFPLCRDAWRKQCAALRPSYRVIAPDLRGLGESEGKPGTTSMAEFASDLHGLLRQLQTGPVVLIGHSMGGYIALAFTCQFPAMLRGLVLVSTKAGADMPEAATGRRATAEKVRAEGTKVVVEAMAAKMLAAGNQDATMAEQVRSLMTRSKPEGVIAALLGMAERPDSTAMLAGIAVPTLVVTGADDSIIPPAESEKLVQAIPGAQLSVIPRAGHLVAFEQPEAFNRALTEWLSHAGLAGRLRRNDLVRALSDGRRDAPVSEVMCRECETVDESAPLRSAVESMHARQCATVPVVAGGRITGLLTLENIGKTITNNAALAGEKPKPSALAEHVTEELGHAQKLANRLKQLGACPPGSLDLVRDQKGLQPAADSTDLRHVIEGVIEAERLAIATYHKIIAACDGVDPVTEDLAVQFLADEEGHRTLFEGFLKSVRTKKSN